MGRAHRAACSAAEVPKSRLTILMLSEFFYPDVGGIETHICALSTKLVALGYRVVVLTRHFGERRGIRYLSNGMKVYHLPSLFLVKPCGVPMFIYTFFLARSILIREQVDIIHVHQTSSRYGYEFAHFGFLMGYRTVFTDHSLFSFTEFGPVLLNESSRHSAVLFDHCICVSNTHKENLVLRSQVNPTSISVIGNAINASSFMPPDGKSDDGRIVIVVVSRLTPTKGTELLNKVISIVCKRHENVDFIIGGDGPLYSSIVEVIDKLYLHNRVTLLGSVPSYKVNSVLKQGDIFLNTSKSESFCIAILEAVSSGLLCVSTNVGGVHEILPRDMVLLANYSPDSIADRIDDAISMLPTVDRHSFHERIKAMYSWDMVVAEVRKVYDRVIRAKPRSPFDLMYAYWQLDTIGRGVLLCLIIFLHVEWLVAEFLYPRDEIDIAPNWSAECRRRQKK